jgi:hypothetical protein
LQTLNRVVERKRSGADLFQKLTNLVGVHDYVNSRTVVTRCSFAAV